MSERERSSAPATTPARRAATLLLLAGVLASHSAGAQDGAASRLGAAEVLPSRELELAPAAGSVEILQFPPVTPVALLATPGERLQGTAELSNLALYGTIRHGMGDGILSLVVDRDAAGEEVLIVDRNDDENLANDPRLTWKGEYRSGTAGQALLPDARITCSLTCEDGTEVPVDFQLWRFERQRLKGRSSITLRDGVLVAVDSYRTGTLNLDGRDYRLALLPTALARRAGLFEHPSNALVIDLNRDGVLDGRPMRSRERFRLGAPFELGDKAYKITSVACDGSRLTLEEVDPSRVQRRPRFAQPSPGDEAPLFALASTRGDTVRLDDYRGKLVLLDFWATWCRPCIAELPYVKRAYDRFHDQGFEIIGISLDDHPQRLEAFVRANGMPWPQIREGRGLTPLKADYGVRAIPAAFLVGEDGRVVARGLRGQHLFDTIAEVLATSD